MRMFNFCKACIQNIYDVGHRWTIDFEITLATTNKEAVLYTFSR